MKKSTKVMTSIILAACVSMPVAAKTGEEEKVVTSVLSYLTSLFSPAPEVRVVRPNKTKF
ncbi:hypothetical protein [Alteromonas sp. BZK5]|jgi:hypothetical protein|uniref:hypothetical protein n=1 Tax=Alteromonas sp. BZK5 TaxID=1904459 RepID=UPI001653E8CF|nr:hypothetical protein [Alteromonas sp. BZK5]MBC6987511.1 hypothetical protein [Alteromonas sp. BZK5]